MGSSCSSVCGGGEESCDKERRCYVDQNEVKITAYDWTSYPQGSKVNSRPGRSLVPDLGVSALMGGASSRSTTASSYDNQKRLQPQSVTWAEGLFRHTGNLLGRFQLIPRANSFSSGSKASGGRPTLTFEQQMGIARSQR